MKYLILFLILSSCTIAGNKSEKISFIDKSFEDLSFEEFRIKLNEYVKKTSFPNINE